MSETPSQLPCRGHRECTIHYHWSTWWVPAAKANATSKNDIPAEHISVSPDISSTLAKVAPIQSLPTELLQDIAVYLSPLDQACLALTCRSLGRVFGSGKWAKYSTAGNASWFMHAEMLDRVQRDFPSDKFWRCRDCMLLHARALTCGHERGHSGLRLSRLSAIFRCKNALSSLRIGVYNDPCYAEDTIYLVDNRLLNAIMDRHFLGRPHGPCLNSLRCKGTRTYELSTTANMVLKYEFEPKVVLDRLLLRSTYKFQPAATMFVQNMQINEASTAVFLEHIDFWICGHQHTAGIMRSLRSQSEGAWVGQTIDLECGYCPTQYQVTATSDEGIRIQVWQNLGSGRSRTDTKWRHLTTTGKRKQIYRWHREEKLDEVFRNVFCSSEAEFRKLAAEAEHWRPWRGRPSRKNGEFKSLPVNIAEWL